MKIVRFRSLSVRGIPIKRQQFCFFAIRSIELRQLRSRKPKKTTIDSTIMDLCISCNLIVTSRQEALMCDGCNKWQHRKCNTGVTRQQYRDAVRAEMDIPWQCQVCTTPRPAAPCPNFKSTRNSAEGNYPFFYFTCLL